MIVFRRHIEISRLWGVRFICINGYLLISSFHVKLLPGIFHSNSIKIHFFLLSNAGKKVNKCYQEQEVLHHSIYTQYIDLICSKMSFTINFKEKPHHTYKFFWTFIWYSTCGTCANNRQIYIFLYFILFFSLLLSLCIFFSLLSSHDNYLVQSLLVCVFWSNRNQKN